MNIIDSNLNSMVQLSATEQASKLRGMDSSSIVALLNECSKNNLKNHAFCGSIENELFNNYAKRLWESSIADLDCIQTAFMTVGLKDSNRQKGLKIIHMAKLRCQKW